MALDPHPCPEIIYWAADSKQLVIAQPDRVRPASQALLIIQLAKEILPRLFKHDKLSSFGRQLNVNCSQFQAESDADLRYMASHECSLVDNSKTQRAMFPMLQSGVVSPPSLDRDMTDDRSDIDSHVHPRRDPQHQASSCT
jgi:hypothetical protein